MISIITPTYNRAYVLENLYQSLRNQTKKAFEWLIIDDGSTDNTQDLADRWKNENNDFTIRYYRKENGGKHRALNRAIGMVRYDWCFIVDSDDYLTGDAIEWACLWIRTIEDDDSFAGVSGLCGMINTDKIIGEYPKQRTYNEYIDATNLERVKEKLTGDKAEIYKIKILKKYPFPEVDNETFISEGIVWNKIAADGYKIRWFNRVIYMCAYLEDGLSVNFQQKAIDNFKGYTLVAKQDLLLVNGLRRGGVVLAYIHMAKKKGISLREVAHLLEISLLNVYIVNLLGDIRYLLFNKLKRRKG